LTHHDNGSLVYAIHASRSKDRDVIRHAVPALWITCNLNQSISHEELVEPQDIEADGRLQSYATQSFDFPDTFVPNTFNNIKIHWR
jgi:hypothetical protein